MADRAALVAEARTWLHTRWRHQASLKGVGTDCVGLLRGVALAMGIIDQATFDEVGALNYGRLPWQGMLEQTVGRFASRIDEADALPGDFVVMDFGSEPHHVAILTDHPLGGLGIIHAYAPARQVVESILDAGLHARVYGWYRFPGVL
jgi:cell wall-associated NlpC family hydrolase